MNYLWRESFVGNDLQSTVLIILQTLDYIAPQNLSIVLSFWFFICLFFV